MSLDGIYAAARRRTEALAEPLSAEDQLVQSMPDASPVKWHLAHTTWFFDAVVLAHVGGAGRLRPDYDVFFNSYYEALGPRIARAERGLLCRPSLDEVRAYRRRVDEAIGGILRGGRAAPQVLEAIELGVNHEEQHQELIVTDIEHAFASHPARPAYREPVPIVTGVAPPLRWIGFAGGLVEIGAAGESFSYDNERARHRVFLEPFSLASRPVTCGEWLEFMHDGGYEQPLLWLMDGWQMVMAQRLRSPLYWEERDGEWWTFTLGGMRRVAPEEPVCHLSYYEADAFARWAEARLPTEAEWECAAAAVQVEGNLLDAGRLHPAPTFAADGLRQLFGDVWEWTLSAYLPYPGFRPATGVAAEYNGKFMSGQMVLRGGSCATPRRHVRASYRNYFPPQARWQFSGVRLARDGS